MTCARASNSSIARGCVEQPVRSGVVSAAVAAAPIRWLIRALSALMQQAGQLVAALLIALIHLYQRLISPCLRPCCRFVPSCSVYAAESLRKHGLIKGAARAAWRLARCQPFARGGLDEP